MHHLFIINPLAGKGKAYKKLIEDIKKYCNENSIDYEIILTQAPNHATKLAAEYSEKYKDKGIKIYAAGGDGTLNEAAKGILSLKDHSHVALGIFPIGNGNDFARNISSKQALNIEAQINAASLTIDVMKVCVNSLEIFGLNAVTVGWDSEIAIDVHNKRNRRLSSGTMAYVSSLLKGLGRIHRTYPLKITLDDKKITGNYFITMTGNGSFYGGGFKAAPLAKLDDGLLDVVMVTKVPYLKLPSLLINYATGKHMDENKKDMFKNYLTYSFVKKITIESTELLPITVDGEGQYSNKLTIEVIKKDLNFLIP